MEPVFISFRDQKTLWVLSHKPASPVTDLVTILPSVSEQELRFSMVLYDHPITLVRGDNDDLFASNRKTVQEVVRAVGEFRRRCGQDKNFLTERRYGGSSSGPLSAAVASAQQPSLNGSGYAAPPPSQNNNPSYPQHRGDPSSNNNLGGVYQTAMLTPQQQYAAMQAGGQQPASNPGQFQPGYPTPQGYQPSLQQQPQLQQPMAPPLQQQWGGYGGYPAMGGAGYAPPQYGAGGPVYPPQPYGQYAPSMPMYGVPSPYSNVSAPTQAMRTRGLNPTLSVPEEEIRRTADPLGPPTLEVSDKVKATYLSEAAAKTSFDNPSKNIFIATMPETKCTVWLRNHTLVGGYLQNNRRYVATTSGVVQLMGASIEEVGASKPVELFAGQLCTFFTGHGYCARSNCLHTHHTADQVKLMICRRHMQLAAMTKDDRSTLESKLLAREKATLISRNSLGLRPMLRLESPVGLIIDGASDAAPTLRARGAARADTAATPSTSARAEETPAQSRAHRQEERISSSSSGESGSDGGDDEEPRINEKKLLALVGAKWEAQNEGRKFDEVAAEDRETLLKAYRAKLVERKRQQRRDRKRAASSSSSSSTKSDAPTRRRGLDRFGEVETAFTASTPNDAAVHSAVDSASPMVALKASLQAIEVSMMLERDELESKGKKGLKKLFKEFTEGTKLLAKRGGKRPRDD